MISLRNPSTTAIRRYNGSSCLRLLTTNTTTTGRPPLAPMPRVFPKTTTSSSQTPAPPPPAGAIRTAWRNGNVLLYFGSALTGLIVVDRYLQYTQHREATELLDTLALEARQQKMALLQQHRDTPALYQCRIVTAYKSMGGTHGLTGARTGHVVDVLEERVGPDRTYHLVRLYDSDDATVDDNGSSVQVGWYPMKYMERVETKSVWRRVLGQ